MKRARDDHTRSRRDTCRDALAAPQARTMKRARDIRDQLVGLMERVEIMMTTCGDEDDQVRKAITSGFFYNCARLHKVAEGAYKTVKGGHNVFIHPGSGAPLCISARRALGATLLSPHRRVSLADAP